MAIAGTGDRVGLIDRNGNYVAQPVYEHIREFSEGRAIASDKDGCVVLDESGRVISDKYEYIADYRSGRAVSER